MRNKLPYARRFVARSLLLAACCVAPAFGLASAAQPGNANNSNAAPGNANSSGTANDSRNTNTSGNTNTNNSNAGNANTGNSNKGNANTGNTNTGNANKGAGGGGTPAVAPADECGQTLRQKPEEWKKDAKLSDLKVVGVTRADPDEESERNQAGLYNTLCVQVNNLAAWMDADTNNDPRKFFLYLDTYPLKAVRGRQVAKGSNFLHFDLQQTSDKETQENWRNILNRPQAFRLRSIPVSIGYDADPGKPDPSEAPISTEVMGSSGFVLVDLNPFWFKVFLWALGITLALFFYLAVVSDLLREDGPRPEGVNKKGRPNRRPFSLGRTQMAFWFFVVIAAYIFIWMVTSSGNTLTGTVLGLMGISAATALGSVLITNSKDEEAQARRDEYQKEKTDIEARIKELEDKQTGPPPAELSKAEQSELKALRKRLFKVTQLLAGASRGFFQDIVSDADGVSFHRFQIIAWTVALGFIFVAQVFNYLTMPDFDATLLGLMGISSGTYLGFKFPEKQA